LAKNKQSSRLISYIRLRFLASDCAPYNDKLPEIDCYWCHVPFKIKIPYKSMI